MVLAITLIQCHYLCGYVKVVGLMLINAMFESDNLVMLIMTFCIALYGENEAYQRSQLNMNIGH